MDITIYSGSPCNLIVYPLPPHPVNEFTMIESSLEEILPQSPLTIFLYKPR